MKYLSFVVSSLVVAVLVSSRAAVSLPAEALEQDSEAPSSEATGNSLYADLQQTVSRSVCPDDMVEIEGDLCQHVKEDCHYYVDARGNKVPPGDMPQQTGRCAEYGPTVCLSTTLKHMHFCIDKYPYPNKVGELPQDWLTWYDAKKIAESNGRRLCTEDEFTKAAEGPNMHPLAYGNGYVRTIRNDHSFPICNMDNSGKGIDVFKATSPNAPMSIKLRGLLKPLGSWPECHSDYFVYEMAGGIDQWVVNETGQPYVSSLKSGHVFGVRNAARPATRAHFPGFGWYETGMRQCLSL